MDYEPLTVEQLAARNLWHQCDHESFWVPALVRSMAGMLIYKLVEAHCRWMNHA